MRFKNYLTGEAIEVSPVKSVDQNIVWCQSLRKYFKVINQIRDKDYLLGTSYFLVEDRQETLKL